MNTSEITTAKIKLRGQLSLLPTKAELRLWKLVGQGLSRKALAKELNRSVKTIDAQLQNLFGKLKINSSLELCVAAFNYGIVTPEPKSLDNLMNDS